MTKFSIGAFIALTITIVALAAFYPEDFSLALGTFIVGALLGGLASHYLFVSIYKEGFERSHKLSERQIGNVNPASFLRETRLSAKEAAKTQTAPSPQQQAIPRFEITGLDQ